MRLYSSRFCTDRGMIEIRAHEPITDDEFGALDTAMYKAITAVGINLASQEEVDRLQLRR